MIVLASAARTASGTAAFPEAVARVFGRCKRAQFLLDLTASATDSGDTLDVYVQSSVDNSTWDDFIHFTQMLGNGGAKKFLAAFNADITPTTALGAPADASLSAGVKQGPVGSYFRVKWVVVDASTANASFTFSIQAQPV